MCAPQEALRYYKGGLLKCAPAVRVPDCTERTNLRKYGTGDMFFSYVARVCLETGRELVGAESPSLPAPTPISRRAAATEVQTVLKILCPENSRAAPGAALFLCRCFTTGRARPRPARKGALLPGDCTIVGHRKRPLGPYGWHAFRSFSGRDPRNAPFRSSAGLAGQR